MKGLRGLCEVVGAPEDFAGHILGKVSQGPCTVMVADKRQDSRLDGGITAEETLEPLNGLDLEHYAA